MTGLSTDDRGLAIKDPAAKTNRPPWRHGPRSLPVEEWPKADQNAWLEARRPGCRLKPGGSAAHLGEISCGDFARRYGAFLAFLERNHRLDREGPGASQVSPDNVADYIAELRARVRSVTVWNCIYKLRRAAQLIAPTSDFSWLTEIEKDLALVMEPKSKFDRFVLAQVLVEAGLTLIAEAETFGKTSLVCARAVRNGLMIALLALCPIRPKNFASLEFGHTIQEIDGRWWIVLSATSTKTRSRDERPVPNFLKTAIDKYVNEYRPNLMRADHRTNALWLSSADGRPMTAKGVALTISTTTRRTMGVDVSPHLFRTAAASTAAIYGGSTPHLASALLNHRDPHVTEEHYNRATSMSAAQAYAAIAETYRKAD
jgi:site-specific recombinase XerD